MDEGNGVVPTSAGMDATWIFQLSRRHALDDGWFCCIDYVAAWIGQSALDSYLCEQAPCFNPYWHGAMLQLARERGLSVAYYAYVIAFLAKATGLLPYWAETTTSSVTTPLAPGGRAMRPS